MKLRCVLAVMAATVIVSTVFASDPGHLEGYVPSAANVEGRFGSMWTTDLKIYHQGASVVHLWFNPADRNNTQVESVVVNLDDPVTVLEDVVGSTFGVVGVGSIHYLADGPVVVTSRTWTSTDPAGSYGQTITGVPIAGAAISGTGQAGTLRMFVDQENGVRTNLGLTNTSGVAVTAEVEIFTSNGEAAPGNSLFSVELPPFGMSQINDLLTRLSPGNREGLIVRVGVSSDQGAVLAYVSTVDNATNDASYQQGFRFGY
jgi:hypothetical protein